MQNHKVKSYPTTFQEHQRRRKEVARWVAVFTLTTVKSRVKFCGRKGLCPFSKSQNFWFSPWSWHSDVWCPIGILVRTLDHSGSLRGALSAARANQLSVIRMQSTCTSPLLHVKGFRDSVPLHGLADCLVVGVVVHSECEISQQEVLQALIESWSICRASAIVSQHSLRWKRMEKMGQLSDMPSIQCTMTLHGASYLAWTTLDSWFLRCTGSKSADRPTRYAQWMDPQTLYFSSLQDVSFSVSFGCGKVVWLMWALTRPWSLRDKAPGLCLPTATHQLKPSMGSESKGNFGILGRFRAESSNVFVVGWDPYHLAPTFSATVPLALVGQQWP